MKQTNLLTFALVILVALAAPMITRADVQDRLFDFNDDYYRQPALTRRRSSIAARVWRGEASLTRRSFRFRGTSARCNWHLSRH